MSDYKYKKPDSLIELASARYGGRFDCSSESIRSLLSEVQILDIWKEEDGTFSLQEACDCYYNANLTKEQLLQFAEELIQLANGDSENV